MYKKLVNVALLGTLLTACDRTLSSESQFLLSDNSASIQVQELAPVEYISWCRDKENHLNKTKEIGDITYQLLYKPAEYVACMEEESTSIQTDTLAKKVEELNGLEYYDFKIEITSGQGELLKYNVSSAEEYNQRVNYFAFQMQNDLKLVDGSDTLDCKLFHFERAYDVAPYAVFLLGFPKGKSANTEKMFFYQDKVFNKGIIKFTYNKNDLKNIPKLKAA